MRRLKLLVVVLAPLVALGTVALQDDAAFSASSPKPPKVEKAAKPAKPHKRVCPKSEKPYASCDAEVVVLADGSSVPAASSTPPSSAYAPADIQSAYNLPNSGAGQTVAIVDAFDNPNAESDLAAYRAQWGLPPCTTANGCFRKVNQNGAASPLPSGDTGWGLEIALDLDAVSAACPNCNILLVEGNSASFDDLVTAVDRAAAMGAVAISNSYGAGEFSGESFYESHYSHPGVAVTVSTGDSGYGTEYPATSANVVAVGGTTLQPSSSARGFTETVWSSAGSGCSKYITKPSWQHDGGCARRTVADVSADANPSTGLAVYNSYGSSGTANWFQVGGTSLSSPLIAATFGLGGNAGARTPSYPYSHTSALFDVTSGSNGSCSGSYLCTAVAGYDGPTGLGTPNATGAFGGADNSSATSSSTSSTSTSTTVGPTTTTAAPTTTSTSTTLPGGTQLVVNPGFESGDFAPGWNADPAALVTNAWSHSGAYSAFLGSAAAPTPAGDMWVSQTIAVPQTTAKVMLQFWYWGKTADGSSDWDELQLRDTSGHQLTRLWKTSTNAQTWRLISKDISSYRGRTIVLWFNVHQDGDARPTSMYLDDVTVTVG